MKQMQRVHTTHTANRSRKTNAGLSYRKACPICQGRITTARRKSHLLRHVDKAKQQLADIGKQLTMALEALRTVG